MTLYGQRINGPDGFVEVIRCEAHEDAVAKAVDIAITSGWQPPKWWEFWKPKWSAACVAEYQRRNEST